MKIIKYIKTTILLLLTFLLGAQTTYAKTELVLPQNQVVFSVEQTPKASTLGKEVQPNVGFLKEKSKFVAVQRSSDVKPYSFSKLTYCLLVKGVDEVFSVTKFKNTIAKIPGVDNGSLTNLPKSFWNDAYKLKPKNTSALKTKVDNIISNGDQSGKLTETLVEDIMTANGYKVGNGRYYGDYETARNGIDGFFYKGDIANPSEIVIIDAKQMKTNGSVKLNDSNPNTQLPVQMTNDWFEYIANNKLTDLQNSLQQSTKTAILNAPDSFIKKYVVAVDKSTGKVNFLKLGDNF